MPWRGSKRFWEGCGSQVEVMDPGHHDLVLAMTSHVPHLIAYNIVGTAHDLEKVTESEVIKFSAGGFRDFTRIAASDPTMWRDVFLNNREAVLEVLGRFNEDLSQLQRAVRDGNGQMLFDLFTRTRAIRRSIVDIGQDTAAPNFGRDRSEARKVRACEAWIGARNSSAQAGPRCEVGAKKSLLVASALDWMSTGPVTISPPRWFPRHDGVPSQPSLAAQQPRRTPSHA